MQTKCTLVLPYIAQTGTDLDWKSYFYPKFWQKVYLNDIDLMCQNSHLVQTKIALVLQCLAQTGTDLENLLGSISSI